jgi:hypothetical protein
MKEERYPNGYGPKLDYYFSLIQQARADEDPEGLRVATAKFAWFAEKEAARLEAAALPELEQEHVD